MRTSDFKLNLAVVIGINEYQNGIPKLGTARQDAEAIAHLLKREYHYQVALITDRTKAQATRQNLKHWLETDLPKATTKATPSRLLFYFAGHGIALNGDEGPQGYLIPQDARLGDVSTYLPMQQMEAALSQLSCRHCLVILDCCFAGAFRWSSTRKLVPITETLYKERYDRFIQDPAWQVITSAASDQYALDNLDLRGDRGIARHNTQHSPFAAALIEALSGAADIYPPLRPGKPAGDGVITATELYLYLRDAVEIPTDTRNQRQTPQIWSLKQHDKGEFIFLPPGHPLNLPPAPSLDAVEAHNPYRGLKSYEVEDSALFFGRTALIETLCDDLSDRPFTVILGASGSGKSSLIKAGVIPHLNGTVPPARSLTQQIQPQTHQCKHTRWYTLPPLRPGESPLLSLNPLCQALGIAAVPDTVPDPQILSGAIATWHQAHPGTKLLLVVDQLEELMTLCRQDQEKQQFLELLAALLEAHSEVLRLVVTLRSDFEPQFRRTPLESRWQAARFVVPGMTRDELQAVIEEPAAAKVVYFESLPPRGYLVDQLVNEVAGMPGALPLLSFTLSELYLKLAQRYRTAQITGETVERVLTWADYDDLGGVTQSLTRRADEVYDSLVRMDPAYERTIRQVMLRMVAVGGELARRQVPESELQYPEPENSRVQTVVERFVAARLLVRGTDAENIPYIEPAHDALVRGWERLLAWKMEEEENLILQRRLTPAAVEWDNISRKNQAQPKGIVAKIAPVGHWIDRQLFKVETVVGQAPARWLHRLSQNRSSPSVARPKDRPAQFLWDSNPYLGVLDQELQGNDTWFNQIEGKFVRESLLQRRRTLSWRWRITLAVIAGLSALTTIALIGQRNALVGQVQASRESAIANFRAGQSLDAFLDSLRAAQTLQQPLLQLFRPPPELKHQVQGLLQQAVFAVPERNRLRGHQGITRSTLSPNGQWIASADEDGRVILWNGRGQAQAQWQSAQGRIMNLSFSPASQQLATAGEDGSVHLWDLQGQLLAQFQGHTDMVKGISFSPDGQQLATSGRDRTVRLWNLQGQPLGVFTGHRQDVWSVVFSPDGQRLASASDDGTVRLWDGQGNSLGVFAAEQGELHTLGFSPDGQNLVTAGEDGRLRLWTMQGQPLAELPGHQGRVWNVVFSADGQQLASASADGTVRLWSRAGQPLAILQGHQGPARHVSFSPDGQRLVSSGDDSLVRLWDLQGQQQVTFTGHQEAVQAIAFPPILSGTPAETELFLATAGADGTVRLWAEQGQLLTALTREDPDPIRAIAFPPHPTENPPRLVSAQGSTLRLWRNLEQPEVEFQAHAGQVSSVQFHPDGQRLASGGGDGRIRLWNLPGQRLEEWSADSPSVWQVVFSPNGQQLASAGSDGIVRLWNLQGESLAQFAGHLGPVYGLDFSPDGRSLASAGQDGTIRVWSLEEGQTKQLFQVYDAVVNSVAFHPDGIHLASGDQRGNVQLWNVQIQQQVAEWSAHPNSEVFQVRFSPDGRHLATAAEDGTANLWALDGFDALFERGCWLMADYLNQSRQTTGQAWGLGTDREAGRDRPLCLSISPS
jgi:WD40 repeat protein/energy-coupling factor transporter ATP-binding protein EcfA2